MSIDLEVAVQGHCYANVRELVAAQPQLRTESATIYLINFQFGLGSALTVYIQNEAFLKQFNPDLVPVPHFSNNTANFKYHDESVCNSFPLYFDDAVTERPGRRFFCHSAALSDFPFFTWSIPLDAVTQSLVNQFKHRFSLKIGQPARDLVAKAREQQVRLVGIHIRSWYQKQFHESDYCSVPLVQRLEAVKSQCPDCVFIVATDVKDYVQLAEQIFGSSVYCLEVARIQSGDQDSVSNLSQFTGTKLGNDILSDCLALSMCDEIFVSPSNIGFLIAMLGGANKMKEY